MHKLTLIAALLVISSTLALPVRTNMRKAPSLIETSWASLQNSYQMRELGKSDLGSSILDTVSLQLQSGGSFDQVLKLLEDLKKAFETEESGDRLQFTKKRQALDDAISLNTQKSAAATTEFNEASATLKELNSHQGNLMSAIIKTKAQLKEVRKEKNDLQDDVTSAEKKYQNRYVEQQQVVKVLTTIINDLTEKALTGTSSMSLAEKKSLFNQITTVGRDNPISGLVDLTSTFDKDAVKNVIVKLEMLKEAILASIASDEAAFKQSSDVQKGMLDKLQKLQDALQTDMSQMKTKLKKIQGSIVVESKRKTNNEKIQQEADAVRKNSEDQLQQAVDSFNKRSGDRTSAIKTIEEAINVLRSANSGSGTSNKSGSTN